MHRFIAALVFAFALLFGAAPGTARAQELRERSGPTEHAITPPPDQPARVLPSDMPVMVSAAHVAIPPVPSTYVKKDLGWLQLSYPPSAEERVAPIVKDAESFKAELVDVLGQRVLDRVEVRITPTVSDMARLAPIDVPPPAYASGVAYRGLHLVLISMLQPRGAEAVDVAETFKHEMVHVALEDATLGQHVPVWFNEGLAIHLSGERAVDRLHVLFSATLSGTLIPFSDLDRSFPADNHEVGIAYAESADFMGFLQRRTDRARFAAMISRIREGQAFEGSIRDAYGSDLRKLEYQWHETAERRFSIIPVLTGGGLVWVLVVFGLGYAYWKKKKRAKMILARWEREEALEDAIALRRAKEAEEAAESFVSGAALANRPSIKIEHDGGWHTLH